MRFGGRRVWAVAAVVAFGGIAFGSAFRHQIDYAIFRLRGSTLAVGPYSVKLSPGWAHFSSRSSGDVQEVLVQPAIYGNELKRSHMLIFSNRQFPLPGNVKLVAPHLTYEWGTLVLISPNATFDGISPEQREPGFAVFEESLTIGYAALNDLAAIRSIRRR
jgi:hypothetical protein